MSCLVGYVGRGSGREHIEVRFGADVYRGYAESELAHQLSALATGLWTRHRRAQRDVTEALLSDALVDEYPDDRRQHYRELLAQIEVSGASPTGSITATKGTSSSFDNHDHAIGW